jgi:hypothetical protein
MPDQAQVQIQVSEDPVLKAMLFEMTVSHRSVPFARKLRTGLRIGGRCPPGARDIGITIRTTPNNVNHNLNDHGFQREESETAAKEIRQRFPTLASEAGKWSHWNHLVVPFNQDMTDFTLNVVINYGKMGRRMVRDKFGNLLTADTQESEEDWRDS